MTKIGVTNLYGVPPEYVCLIRRALILCPDWQRLAVCLYFISDLRDADHSLESIERHVRPLWTQGPYSRDPRNYADFQATAIRAIVNAETAAVTQGELRDEHRLWQNIRRGFWRQKEVGHRVAIRILHMQRILVEHRGLVINASELVIPPEYEQRLIADYNRTEPFRIRALASLKNISEPCVVRKLSRYAPRERDSILNHEKVVEGARDLCLKNAEPLDLTDLLAYPVV